MLDIRDLIARAGTFTLADVSLAVAEGTCHVIVGATGSGKTLLLESVLGLRKPAAGAILLNGTDITSLPLEKRGIAYVPQDLALFPHLTVEENIFYGLRVKRIRDSEHEALVSRLMETVGIGGLARRSIGNLSGGERQRVALVRAIAAGNSHLLLDEPFSALHQGLRRELWFVLKELQRTCNLTVLMVTHDMEEAFFLGERVTVLMNGSIQQSGEARDVYEHPANAAVARFFGIRNLFAGRVLSVGEAVLNISCEALRGDFVIPVTAARGRGLEPGASCTIGIRPENVMILKQDRPSRAQDNLLTGTVTEILLKGASHTVLFAPAQTGLVVELEVPDYALRKLQIASGDAITIFFKGESLFLL